MPYSRFKRRHQALKTVEECPYEWGYIFGVQYSDGYKPRKQRYSLYIGLGGISREYLELYLKAIQAVSGKTYSIAFLPSHNQYSVKVWHRELIDFIIQQGVCGTFIWRIPKFIINGSFETKKGFLNGFLDGDGYSAMRGKHVTIGFRSANRLGLEDIKKILASLHIHSEVFENKYYDLIIYRLTDARNYIRDIGISLRSKRLECEQKMKLRGAIVLNKSWMPEEVVFLKQNYGKLQRPAIAALLHRSISGIEYKALKLGLTRHRWTQDELKSLLDNKNKKRTELATSFGKSVNAVNKRLSRLLADSDHLQSTAR